MKERMPITLLVAEDDAEDRMLLSEAIKQANLVKDCRFVEDGVEMMDYLLHRGKYADPVLAPRPGLIVLDLNMPRKDGRQTLKEIKSNPLLRSIPVVILTSSRSEDDILKSYDTGASTFISKPSSLDEFSETVKSIGAYWFEHANLPVPISTMFDKQIRILLIEDDEEDYIITRNLLAEIGDIKSDLKWAATYEDAMAIIKRGGIDLCILDYRLGEKDGLQVLRDLAAEGCKFPILFMTGQGHERIAVDAMKSGAADYIVKQYLSKDMLKRSIINALEQAELAKQLDEKKTELEQLATTDALTGIYNRRYIFDRLSQEITRSLRYGSPLCVSIIDLDNFKKINDTYGHIVGDMSISRAAEILKGSLRGSDVPGRYGGDEFCVILMESRLGGALKAMHKIRKMMAKETFSTSRGDSFQLTCSIGIAQLIEGISDMTTFLNRADSAMYEAKAAGRNRIAVAHGAE